MDIYTGYITQHVQTRSHTYRTRATCPLPAEASGTAQVTATPREPAAKLRREA